VVVRTTTSKRSAFTLIEVIFAIVIIAIAVLSLPMMGRATQKGIESSIAQEAIFAASAELMGATSGYWDEISMLDVNVSHLSRVININDVAECNTTTKLRPGHINQIYHRRCIDDTTINAPHDSNTSYLGADVFDLNDAVHGVQDIFIDATTNATGYKETYKSTLTVATNNNIKVITATVYKDDGTTVITSLKMQSANVGEIDYYKRMF